MNNQDIKNQEMQSQPAASGVSKVAEMLGQLNTGSLPVLLGLILIAIIFQLANSNFLTPLNLTNLMVQISAVGTISVGVVLVLLIGEIDLSVGAVSGLCAGVMAVLSVKLGWPAPVAILALSACCKASG
jgi:D-xylose transport system permease protein